jgi:hypothetical protein
MTSLSLVRKVFTTSRLAEFCSEKELVNQTGHDSDDWPLVVLKELIDNALDARRLARRRLSMSRFRTPRSPSSTTVQGSRLRRSPASLTIIRAHQAARPT